LSKGSALTGVVAPPDDVPELPPPPPQATNDKAVAKPTAYLTKLILIFL
jgi:hypothetical protein